MTERPILFSAPMVRAIFAGTKTQTRRVVKPQPERRTIEQVGSMLGFKKRHGEGFWLWPNAKERILAECPYRQPGDRLWVRETWALIDKDYKPADLAQATSLVYRADGLKMPKQNDPEIRAIFADRCRMPLGAIKWRPSIHMPRWASRILLEVVSVRVERLSDISAEDAIAEGMPIDDAIHDYSRLWDQINGAGSWTANPWVWVIEFRKLGAGETAT